jgi:hypothetical protein
LPAAQHELPQQNSVPVQAFAPHGGGLHCPFSQYPFGATHMFPQWPQLSGSLSKLEHRCEQQLRNGPHGGEHVPPSSPPELLLALLVPPPLLLVLLVPPLLLVLLVPPLLLVLLVPPPLLPALPLLAPDPPLEPPESLPPNASPGPSNDASEPESVAVEPPHRARRRATGNTTAIDERTLLRMGASVAD